MQCTTNTYSATQEEEIAFNCSSICNGSLQQIDSNKTRDSNIGIVSLIVEESVMETPSLQLTNRTLDGYNSWFPENVGKNGGDFLAIPTTGLIRKHSDCDSAVDMKLCDDTIDAGGRTHSDHSARNRSLIMAEDSNGKFDKKKPITINRNDVSDFLKIIEYYIHNKVKCLPVRHKITMTK